MEGVKVAYNGNDNQRNLWTYYASLLLDYIIGER